METNLTTPTINTCANCGKPISAKSKLCHKCRGAKDHNPYLIRDFDILAAYDNRRTTKQSVSEVAAQFGISRARLYAILKAHGKGGSPMPKQTRYQATLTSAKVPQELKKAVVDLAVRLNVSEAAIVRMAVSEFVRKEQTTADNKSNPTITQ